MAPRRAAPALALVALVMLPASYAQLVDDWLVTPPSSWPQPTFDRNPDGTYTLSNGLVSRTFAFEPSFGTVDLYSYSRGASLLRAIDVEAYLGLDGTVYALGGLLQTGTFYHAYLNRSDTGAQSNPDGWNATGWSLGPPVAPVPWTPGTRGSPADAPWPPPGLTLSVTLAAPASAPPAHRAVSVTLHYQLVVGVPLLPSTMPPPDRRLTVALNPFRSSVLPDATLTLPLPAPLGMTFAAPSCSVPVLTAVLPL